MLIVSDEISALVSAYPKEKRHSLAILQDMQRQFGYIPRESLTLLADHLGVKISSLYAMATFYKALSLKPKGKHILKVCDGTACHIRGSVTLIDALERRLGIKAGETTQDGLFTIETVNCLGACAIAPVLVVDEKYYPKVTPEQVGRILEGYLRGETDG